MAAPSSQLKCRIRHTKRLNDRIRPYGWVWEPVSMTLRHTKHGYYVPVTDMTTSAAVLDWIAQLAEKTWLSYDGLGAFCFAVNELLRLQATLCRSGIERGPIDVTRAIAGSAARVVATD